MSWTTSRRAIALLALAVGSASGCTDDDPEQLVVGSLDSPPDTTSCSDREAVNIDVSGTEPTPTAALEVGVRDLPIPEGGYREFRRDDETVGFFRVTEAGSLLTEVSVARTPDTELWAVVGYLKCG